MGSVLSGRYRQDPSYGRVARPAVGERHPSAKLTDADVVEIRARAAIGVTQSALARKFRVTDSCISNIVRGKTRASVAFGAATFAPT